MSIQRIRCPKCSGSGLYGRMGMCYRCKGVGTVQLESTPEPIKVDASRLFLAFQTAKDLGVQVPRMRVEGMMFKASTQASKYQGSILVLDPTKDFEQAFLGRISIDGVFHPSARTWDPSRIPQLHAALFNPEQAAVAYGRRIGTCSICGRTLTNHESIDRGIGPICAGRMGWGPVDPNAADEDGAEIHVDADIIDSFLGDV